MVKPMKTCMVRPAVALITVPVMPTGQQRSQAQKAEGRRPASKGSTHGCQLTWMAQQLCGCHCWSQELLHGEPAAERNIIGQLHVWACGNKASCVQGWIGNVMGGPVSPRQTVQDAACCVQKRVRSPAPWREALALGQIASPADSSAQPSTAAASLGDVAQAAPTRGSRGGRAAKVRRRCSPAPQPAAACPPQPKAAPLAGTAAGTCSGVHAAGMAEPEGGPTLQQAADQPAQLRAAPAPSTTATNTTGVRAVGIAAAGPSAAIAEQCPGHAPGCAGSSQQHQLPAEGVDLQPGSPGPSAEHAPGNCGALAEQPLSGSSPATCQDPDQGAPEAACAQPGRPTAPQQVREPGVVPAPPGEAGGGQHGCTELARGLSAPRDGAEAAGRAEETSGRPLAAGWLHSTTLAGMPPAQAVRHNRRVSSAGHPYPLGLQFRRLCGPHHMACVAVWTARTALSSARDHSTPVQAALQASGMAWGCPLTVDALDCRSPSLCQWAEGTPSPGQSRCGSVGAPAALPVPASPVPAAAGEKPAADALKSCAGIPSSKQSCPTGAAMPQL